MTTSVAIDCCMSLTQYLELPAKSILRDGPVGHLAAVPDEVPPVLTLYLTSKQKRGPYLMLGSIRFLNSHCDPNCRYYFDKTDKVVQLETLKRITPGDELLVKYSEEFFDDEECLCATCTAKKVASDTFTPAKFSEQMTCQLETGSNVADETVTPVSIETSERHFAEIVNDVALPPRKKSKSWCSPRRLSNAARIREYEMEVEKYQHLISWSSEGLLLEENVESATLPEGLQLFEVSNHLVMTETRRAFSA